MVPLILIGFFLLFFLTQTLFDCCLEGWYPNESGMTFYSVEWPIMRETASLPTSQRRNKATFYGEHRLQFSAYDVCYTDSGAPRRHKLERLMHQGQLRHDRRSNQLHYVRHTIYAASQ